MKAKGVIRDIVPWERAREYFFWRVRRRLAQDALVSELKAADSSMSAADAVSMLQEWMGGAADWADDKAVLAFFESKGTLLEEKSARSRSPPSRRRSSRSSPTCP